MAKLTLTNLVAEIQDHIPDKEEATIVRAANRVIRELTNEGNLYTKGSHTFTTTAPRTTGTVSVTQSGTTVTGTDFVDEDLYQIIQIEGSNHWYPITAVTAGVSCEIDGGWESTDVTDGGYTVAYHRYVMPVGTIQIKAIKRPNRNGLTRINDELYDNMMYHVNIMEPTRYYLTKPLNSAGSPEIILMDWPDGVYSYTVVSVDAPTLYGAGGSDTCNLPENYELALIYGTLMHCWDQEDEPLRAKEWERRYFQQRKEARRGFSPANSGRMHRADEQGPRYPLPHSYGLEVT